MDNMESANAKLTQIQNEWGIRWARRLECSGLYIEGPLLGSQYSVPDGRLQREHVIDTYIYPRTIFRGCHYLKQQL